MLRYSKGMWDMGQSGEPFAWNSGYPKSRNRKRRLKEMKRIAIVGLTIVVLTLAWATPVSAAPNKNASHVAQCAVNMGGQHVAACAHTLTGVSECAQMRGPCPHAR